MSVHCIDVYLIALNVVDFKLNAYKVLKDYSQEMIQLFQN